ncbi:7771_t:CDS:1 [Paraglomus occultum]|uniref:7771_t:CDS:1 n=1 Tax=Paraglomus occultum TaxID=144539 RepID=A0A9N8W4G7_9GLOM|nr:7771_t:CDS:1 [Paraglomus occultum]
MTKTYIAISLYLFSCRENVCYPLSFFHAQRRPRLKRYGSARIGRRKMRVQKLGKANGRKEERKGVKRKEIYIGENAITQANIEMFTRFGNVAKEAEEEWRVYNLE